MKWTKDVPKEPGIYLWCELTFDVPQILNLHFVSKHDRRLVDDYGHSAQSYNGVYFAGPVEIEEPDE